MNNIPVFKRIRNSRTARGLSLLIVAELLVQTVQPLALRALTSGPAQPEVEGFQPIGLTEMVDPFTGDFSYSIPLMEIGGYPLNLSYQSGISMDQEASWAGLGWNLHTGAITRQMRGLPDDFSGDVVTERMNLKPNKTIGVDVTFDMEIFGFEANSIISSGFGGGSGNMSVGLGVEYNNYTGVSLTTTSGLSLSGGSSLPMNASLNMTSGKDGLQISPNVSYSARLSKSGSETSGRASIGIGANINSRRGLTNINLNGGVNVGKSKENAGSFKHFSNKEKKEVKGTFSSGGKGGINNSSSISMGNATFTPSIENAMETYAFSGRFKIGGATLSQDFGGSISASGSVQKLMSKEVSAPAYGYVYSERANNNDNALLDYNREKDNAFSTHHKNLPLTAFTHDMFSIAAQGVGGTFRVFRNDVGYVYNNKKFSPSNSGALGVEIGLGNIVDAGIDININTVTSSSGAWRDQNNAIGAIPFRSGVKNDANAKENYFLRMTGEKIPEQDPSFVNATLKGKDAIRYKFDHKNGLPMLKVKNELLNAQGASQGAVGSNERSVRQRRNTAVYFLTVDEIRNAYPHKAKYISPHAKGHHIAEITVVTDAGMRYVFGLAAYNTKQVERSFAVGGTMKNPGGGFANGSAENDRGLVNYTAAAASTNNAMGIDNFFQETETPAYAHSWMLTEILSPDYSDLKGDGPTQDDLGAYVLFTYGNEGSGGKRVPDVAGYGWRTPAAGAFKAGYMEGLRTVRTDDKANMVFGTKDIWYCHTIESKTHKVLFELEDRFDSYGVGEHGTVNMAQKLKCIRSISYVSAEAAPGAPPIKKVHFLHSYSLCPGTPNASSGKLTLTGLYFTYENSNSGRYSPYTFTYDTGASGDNPAYSHGDNDRWGIMKKAADNPASMSNGDYPYALQDKTKQDAYSAAWSLKKIELPSGGKIHISYESDDYAWVQDRRACNMYTIAGFAATKNGTVSDQTFTKDDGPNDYLIVNIPDAGSALSSDEFRNRYLREDDVPGDKYGPLKYLYFRFLMNVNKPNDKKFEYVSGYAEIDRTGDWCGMTSSTRGYIKIKRIIPAPGGDPSSPFAYAAWSFSRAQTPVYAYNQPSFEDDDAEYIIKTLASASVVKNLFDMLTGVNRRMRREGYGSHVDVARSWVKLFDPDGIKYGGGSRVKRLEISDEWSSMAGGEPGRMYGQEFTYRLQNGRSSGVAAWEPGMGSDENPFKKPVYSEDKKLSLVMEERFYVEEPFGESFFPSPGVGYSRVEIKDIVYDAGVTSKSTGKMVHEFYTAKDFPTLVRQTAIDPVRKRSNPIVSLLSFNSWDLMNVSQGYTIEVNDMHGKPRAERMYAEGAEEPFAYKEFIYKKTGVSQLDNMFPVIGPDGVQSEAEVGVEYDMVADFREQETIGHNGSLAFNINYGMIGMLPFFSFSLFPGYKRTHTRFRSAVVTKLVQRYGLLINTISFDKGALLETRTLALDKMTGNTVVQELTNEFKDKYYKTDIPAHWSYAGMGQAGSNIGYTFGTSGIGDVSVFNRNTGEITSAAVKAHLQPGDEVMIKKAWIYVSSAATNNSNAYRYWVARDEADVNKKMYLINYAGEKAVFTDLFPAAAEFKVLRSGRRNLQQIPVGSVTSIENPIRNVSGTYKLVFDQDMRVIATDATEFREQWQTDLSIQKTLTDTIVHDGPGEDTLITSNLVMGYLNLLIQEGQLSATASAYPGPYNYPSSSAYNYYFQSLIGCLPYSGGLQMEAFEYLVGPGFTGIYGIQAGDHAALTFAIPGSGSGCIFCEVYQVIAWDDISGFSIADWANVAAFENVLALEMHTIGFSSPRFYLVEGRMNDNSIRKFIFIDPCFRPVTHADGSSFDLEYVTTYYCTGSDDIVNPYIHGILGNWRTHRSWTFQGDRNNMDVSLAENLRRDGYMPQYKPFWTYDAIAARWKRNPAVNSAQYNNWNWTNEMTVYSPYGFDLENMNPLGLFSAAIYGFKNMLATGVAQNARNKEVGYDGFEDYYQDAFDHPCPVNQFWIANSLSQLSDETAHSGRYSMKISGTYERSFGLSPQPQSPQTPTVPYQLNANDLWMGFSPGSGVGTNREFVLSFWARAAYDPTSTTDYPGISADVLYDAGTPSSILVAGSLRKTRIIEGWQKFEYRFTVPASASAAAALHFRFNTGGGNAWFDDIRVHPFDANMKNYVYDRNNFRFKAELDENNFASFYDYDQEGKLVRIKKETERGIMTVQENRSTTYKRW